MHTNKIFNGLGLLSCAFIVCLFPFGSRAQTAPSALTPEQQAANELFQAKKWPEAAEAYGNIVRAMPQNPRAWYRLGFSLHSLRQFQQAAVAFEKAIEIGQQPGAMYGAAAAYARLNQPEKAFAWLKKAADAGFAQADQFKDDADFTGLRSDPRFAEVATAFAINAEPCAALPRYHDFDFFIGDWDVQGLAGTPAATNSIHLVTGKCILFENYVNGPYSGKSFSYYDSTIGKWRQTYVDSTGSSATFVGEFADGAMRFEGESHQRTGPATKIRMTLFNQGPNRLRQLGETTNDGGKTWSVSYDLTYTRKKT